MRRWPWLIAVLMEVSAAPVPTPPVVTSTAPEHLSVTVYRAPYRQGAARMDLRYLGGFALVTETRTVTLPAGDAVLRFEGVAGGIVPASAVITGLPGGTIEKNRDARLLSPAALVDGTLGRRITLRRTDKASGVAREEEAVIVSGPAGGVVVRTPSGIETLGCSGLAEKPIYPGVPAALSARPTLSVTTRSPVAATATVTLSYLASDFDWSASYVATIAKDGKSLDLFAWLTLANGNAESFAEADVQAVAGRLERRQTREIQAAAARLTLSCYPLGTTTSDLHAREEIIVTGSRVVERAMMMVPAPVSVPSPPPPPPPEDLGDLKLYRVPERVTVAANAQKQVALLERRKVPFERLYRIALFPDRTITGVPARIVLRMRNDAAAGLGLPLPAGSTALYGAGAKLLLGLGTFGDTAEGQRVSIAAGISRQVIADQRVDANHHAEVTLTNANPFAVTVEVPIGGAGDKALRDVSMPLVRDNGVQTWRVTLLPNGRASFRYRRD